MPRHFRTPTLAFAAFAAVLGGFAAEPAVLSSTSPFLPAPGSAAPAAAVAETLEFAGVSTLQKQTLISIFNTQEKRGRWIAVGTTAEGIEVLSYDPARDQVAVRYGGELKVLSLRKPGKVVNSGFTAAPPVFATPLPTTAAANLNAPLGPKKPLTIAQQEEEARMFVADMLDIGMQNRKAYEEAQKKAAAEKAGIKSTPTPLVVPAVGG